jgi:hypothetical protein
MPWARIGEQVGHDDLVTTARTYTHVLADERELDVRNCSVCERDETVPIDWMVGGAIAALDRLLAATRNPAASAGTVFRPLFEALNWAASIDLTLLEQGRPVGSDLLEGIRFARDRVHHQWALALERHRHTSPASPVVYTNRPGSRIIVPPIPPISRSWWAWLPPGRLPGTRRGGEDAYRRCLATRDAEPTLESLRPVLEGLRT